MNEPLLEIIAELLRIAESYEAGRLSPLGTAEVRAIGSAATILERLSVLDSLVNEG